MIGVQNVARLVAAALGELIELATAVLALAVIPSEGARIGDLD